VRPVARRRQDLTPLESELRPTYEQPLQERPGLGERIRRRRERKMPTTLGGAIARGLLRLAIVAGVTSGIALGVNHLTNRGDSFGFYGVGAGLLAVAFLSWRPIREARTTTPEVSANTASA
jgi:hypothetical protein